MVKPVVNEHQESMDVYLPDDQWVHLWTGDHYEGGKEVHVSCPVGYPPVFYRKKSSFAFVFEAITKTYR